MTGNVLFALAIGAATFGLIWLLFLPRARARGWRPLDHMLTALAFDFAMKVAIFVTAWGLK